MKPILLKLTGAMSFKGNIYVSGRYARVSTQEQDLQLQIDALEKIGCERIYTEKASGAQRNRPELIAALNYMRRGDTLVVWKLCAVKRGIESLI